MQRKTQRSKVAERSRLNAEAHRGEGLNQIGDSNTAVKKKEEAQPYWPPTQNAGFEQFTKVAA